MNTFAPPLPALGSLRRDLAALRAGPELGAALPRFTVPRIVESDALAPVSRACEPLSRFFDEMRRTAETLRGLSALPTFNLEN